VTDELDDYEHDAELVEALEDEIQDELVLADAEQLADDVEERDETPFDTSRHAYSGVDEGEADVDVEELAEAGALLDDPDGRASRA
jgi:hypothetical protein